MALSREDVEQIKRILGASLRVEHSTEYKHEERRLVTKVYLDDELVSSTEATLEYLDDGR